MNTRIEGVSAVRLETMADSEDRGLSIVLAPKKRRLIADRVAGKLYRNPEAADAMMLALDIFDLAERLEDGDTTAREPVHRLLLTRHDLGADKEIVEDGKLRQELLDTLARRAKSVRDGFSGDWENPDNRAFLVDVTIARFTRRAGRHWADPLEKQREHLAMTIQGLAFPSKGGKGRKGWKEPFGQLCEDVGWPSGLSKVKPST